MLIINQEYWLLNCETLEILVLIQYTKGCITQSCFFYFEWTICSLPFAFLPRSTTFAQKSRQRAFVSDKKNRWPFLALKLPLENVARFYLYARIRLATRKRVFSGTIPQKVQPPVTLGAETKEKKRKKKKEKRVCRKRVARRSTFIVLRAGEGLFLREKLGR